MYDSPVFAVPPPWKRKYRRYLCYKYYICTIRQFIISHKAIYSKTEKKKVAINCDLFNGYIYTILLQNSLFYSVENYRSDEIAERYQQDIHDTLYRIQSPAG